MKGNDIGMKQILRIFLLVLLSSVFFTVTLAFAATIDTYRFQVKMHDADGKIFYVTVFSDDETSTVVKYAGADGAEGDVLYSGHYQFILSVQPGNPVRQEPAIFPVSSDVMIFNANRPFSHVGGNPYANQPDVLFVAQPGNSNNTPFMAFYIKSGKMQPITWRVAETERSEDWNVKNGYRFSSTQPGIYMTSAYDNTQGGFIHRDWKLDSATDSFISIRTYFVPYDQEPRG